jgi:hypothetical protein
VGRNFNLSPCGHAWHALIDAQTAPNETLKTIYLIPVVPMITDFGSAKGNDAFVTTGASPAN